MDSTVLVLLKAQLKGSQLVNRLIELGLTKWRVHKDCDISYRTLVNWQNKSTIPSDELAIRVGKYLGLIDADEEMMLDIKKRQDELSRDIKRLTK